MSTAEFVLIIICIAISGITPLLMSKIKQPFNAILKLASALFLLAVIWFFADNAKIFWKVCLSLLMAYSIFRTIREYIAMERQAEPDMN